LVITINILYIMIYIILSCGQWFKLLFSMKLIKKIIKIPDKLSYGSFLQPFIQLY